MRTRRSVTGWLTVAMILGQLAIIWIKDLREHGASHAFLGYAPNLVAAATLPGLFVVLLLRRGFDADAPYAWSQLWREDAVLFKALLIVMAGLLAWEFAQVYRPNRTFDPQDIWATLAGGALWLATAFAGRALTAASHRRLVATNSILAESASP
ncbi:hypothetical protein [Lysobacter solisilvae (ex Woo and Kim 2020)]|uniref:Uncharacterized protein n=1 Tax=Agrilutibacter terrestris TaxID=2865112 RepID=A0A7H0FY76_9GAMM|nr:hypothetical protein [Lysobacter terrestris]QNP40992.1 hypothetical protein H8B22_01735 [Lysobacter terrestris]